MGSIFRPALIVVDFQEDFCPPNGSLAVPNGRDIVHTVNRLLESPFCIKIATKDWHPADHVSFASNHAGKEAFKDTTTVVNPHNPSESYETQLWPVHCVQGTPGAELVPELISHRLDKVINKGTDPRVEMYSPFYDPLQNPRISDSGLAELLKRLEITHVYIVGLAADYCVKNCAIDSAKEGFKTYIVEEGTRAVDPDGWPKCREELRSKGVKVVSVEDREVQCLLTAFYE